MKLTNEELSKLIQIMKKFHSLHIDLQGCEDNLMKIDKEKENLTAKLEELKENINLVRNEESEFTSQLVNKYGEFKLNLETFEIEPS